MVLYINSCVRAESRTDRLARKVLEKLGEYAEVRLDRLGLKPLDAEKLDRRTELIARQAWDDPMFDLARQFAAADTIVIAAPYWDGSFPSLLKVYMENIYAIGIVTTYDEQGRPVGLCRAKKLYYVVTAGGQYVPDYSYDYISALVRNMFGIAETECVSAEGLDLVGNDPEKILREAMEKTEHD